MHTRKISGNQKKCSRIALRHFNTFTRRIQKPKKRINGPFSLDGNSKKGELRRERV
jgi:hypothetical protein